MLGTALVDDFLRNQLSVDRPTGVARRQSQQEECDKGDPDHDDGNLEEPAQQKGEQDCPVQSLGKASILRPALYQSAQCVQL
jgi:hypothetical protein